MTTTRSLIRRAAVEALEGRVFMHAGHEHVLPTPLPHQDDPAKQQEHLALFDLVPDAEATAVAVRSGGWSKRSTWKDRVVPGLDAKVLIPAKVTVKVDRQFPTEFEWVRVKGTLAFATKANTLLKVDTIAVDPGGQYLMGTSRDPVRAKYTARVVFTDDGAIDPARDPLQLSRGLIAHGISRIAGAKTTSHVNLAKPAVAGDSVLHLAAAPTGWQVGGRVVVPDVYGEMKDEERTILAIRKNVVTLSAPLAQHHTLDAESGVSVPVAYLDRNVRFASENAADVARRGHVMFMHSPDVQVADAQFAGLGRTRHDVGVTDPQLDANGALVPGTGDNVRARYALHFHRTGADLAKGSTVHRVSVVDSAKFGVVNHGGNVTVEDSLVLRANGSGFFTEQGDEIGAFRRNLAIGTRGLGDAIVSEEHFQPAATAVRTMRDFGRMGNGFWFQGNLVEATGNVAVGNQHAGFASMPVPLTDNKMAERVPIANLPDPSWMGGYDALVAGDLFAFQDAGGKSVPFAVVPVSRFKDNVAIASTYGLFLRGFGRTGSFAVRSVFENFTAVNIAGEGVAANYSENFTLVNPRLFGGSRRGDPGLADRPFQFYGLGRWGWGTNSTAKDQEIVGGEIRHFHLGIQTPSTGDFRADGVLLDNPVNVFARTIGRSTMVRDQSVRRLTLMHTDPVPDGSTIREHIDLLLESGGLGPSGHSPSDRFFFDDRQVGWPEQGTEGLMLRWRPGLVPGIDPGTAGS